MKKLIICLFVIFSGCGKQITAEQAIGKDPIQMCNFLYREYCHKCYDGVFDFCVSYAADHADCKKTNTFKEEFLDSCQNDIENIDCSKRQIPRSCEQVFE